MNNFNSNKSSFRKESAKLSFEEKIRIVVELQKLSFEMSKANPKRKNSEFRAIFKLD